MEVVATSLSAHGGEILDLEVAGLFEVVIVSDDVGVFLSERRTGSENQECENEDRTRQNQTKERGHEISLQVICNC
jgi:hypothetical protein